MKLEIKKFEIEMEIKNKGIEIAVVDNADEKHRGDLIIGKKYLIWCRGRTTRKYGKKITWDNFIQFMETQ